MTPRMTDSEILASILANVPANLVAVGIEDVRIEGYQQKTERWTEDDHLRFVCRTLARILVNLRDGRKPGDSA